MTQTSEALSPSVPNATGATHLEPAGFAEENNPEAAALLAMPVAATESEEPSEVERLEALLFARTRSHGDLQRELERKDRLLREALLRMSTSTSQEFSALRAGYDAAVARAIEAEVAKAELTFALDEARAQLTAAAPAGTVAGVGGVGEQRRAASVYVNGVERSQPAAALQPAAVSSELTGLRTRNEALRGERSGLLARAAEAEAAWQAAHALSQKLHQRIAVTQARVDELRAETAELTLLAQTRAARIAELMQASGLDQQELRALRAQVTTANAAQVAEGEAREVDRQLWSDRFSQQQEREQAAWKAATEAVARSESRLREFLVSLEQPLKDLDSALDALNSADSVETETVEQPRATATKKASVRAERTSAGTRAAARAQQAEEPASASNAAHRLKNSSADE